MTSGQTYRVCSCFPRRFNVTAAEAPAEVQALFDRYSKNGLMDAGHLRRFLIEVQKEDEAAIEDAQAIIDGLHDIRHLNPLRRQ